MWQKIDDLTGSPGPRTLRGGNLQAGFFGEVPAKDFITGDDLASNIGFTKGRSAYSNEPWLKFAYMGKIEFVSKKIFRWDVSWDDIYAVGAVFGNRDIQIGGKYYKIRLMKGKTEGKQNDQSAYHGDINHNSEWNKLMLPIHKNAPSNWRYKDNVNSPTKNWGVGYTNAELLTDSSVVGFGYCSWCQEFGDRSDRRLSRGGSDVSDSSYSPPSFAFSVSGWRPVLELID